MGKRDIITKEYLRKNEIFADACNFLLYDGRQVIRPEDLSEKDTNELVRVYGRNNKPYLLQKYRDVLKNCIMKEAGDVYYIMIGMEGQSEINHAMVVRNLLYDAISYSAQVKALADKNRSAEESGKKKSAEFLSGMGRSDRLMPVITITVHFGQETWDAAKSLHELFEVPDRNMLEFIPDYRINLITPAEISRFDKFRTTLGPVLNFIKNSRDAAKLRELVAENETFQELDVEVAQLLGLVSE